MTTAGDRVIEAASSKLGEHESPPGSNRGTFVDMINARFHLVGTPWCGSFVSWTYAEAGVDDGGLCHPSTAEICRRARAAGAVWDGHSPIPSGALFVICGIHTGLLNTPLGGSVWSTIEGNAGDAVSTGQRSVLDGLVVIPPSIREAAPPPVRTYWLEDTKAQPKLYGPWADKTVRDRKLGSIPAPRRARARLVNHRDHKQWAWIEGARRLYGPWQSQDARDAAREALVHRLGHDLRAFSREVSDGT
jgi:hypothetical protein